LALNAETISKPVIVGSLVFHADNAVAEWVKQKIPHMRTLEWESSYSAIGVIRRGEFVGGVVFHNYRGFDIHLSAAFERGWATPTTIRDIAAYPFTQLSVKRVTAITGKKNKRARRALGALGFELEGVAKRGLDGFEDAMIYGLLRERCKWVKDNGNRFQTAARA